MKLAIQHGNPLRLPEGFNTLSGMLLHIAERYPGHGLLFPDASGTDDFVSYPDLVVLARKYLDGLKRHDIRKGDRVIVEIENPKIFYRVFWACMFGGVIAAPVSRPLAWEPGSPGLAKFAKIWEVMDRPVVIIEETQRYRYESLRSDPSFAGLTLLSTDELESDNQAEIVPTDPDDLVFLQFSSGSTGIPKGVKLTNRNILANNMASVRALHASDEDIVFTWLPHTHDMGLFGQHLTPIASGSRIVVFTPYMFIRSPYFFLKKLSDLKGTWFCSPNFGYDWMVRKVSDDLLPTLDLSSLRFSLNGAEPISTAVMNRFIEKFSVCGYRKEMMFPAYGMAEATVAVTLSGIGKQPVIDRISRTRMSRDRTAVIVSPDDSDGVTFTRVGTPVEGMSVRIADEHGNTLREAEIGEIQIQGDSVTSGYYNQEQQTAELFQEGWLRTGDLGYIKDGELVITGRMKDLIIVRGQNYFAHDLEEILYETGAVPHGSLMLVGLFNARTQQEELLAFVKHKGDIRKLLPIRQTMTDRLRETTGIEITHVIPVKSIPKTTSGKLQRYIMANQYESGQFDRVIEEIGNLLADRPDPAPAIADAPDTKTMAFLRRIWSEVLNIPERDIRPDDAFLRLGGNSVKAYLVLDRVERHYRRTIGPEMFLRCKTIREMAEYLESAAPDPDSPKTFQSAAADTSSDRRIAVTGLALRVPGAKTREAFWHNLVTGTDTIRKVSDKRKRLAGRPDWDEWIGELEDVERFDNDFFDISDQEAVCMDPQIRLLLEVAYEALEDAGVLAETDDRRKIGVYAGGSESTYYHLVLDHVRKHGTPAIHPNAMVGNMSNMHAAYLSRQFNFSGPAVTVHTACSSFLAAVHHAVTAIRQGQIAAAVVAGANVLSTPDIQHLSRIAGICSSTRHTRAFDKNADGSVIGEGAIVVFLEPLADAIRGNRKIYGVIRGSAINNDGYSLSMMAPNPTGQAEVLEEAYRDAGVSPEEISYIEAHGSGTAIGDPVEVSALNRVFAPRLGEARGRVGIGSVKTNIGHLFPAAGGAGLAKVLLSFRHRQLPPSLHADEVNPALQLDKTPFYLVKELRDWPAENGKARKAGISSFGLGGTNVHIVLEEWNGETGITGKNHRFGDRLLTFSAKSEQALSMIIEQTAKMLESNPNLSIDDLTFTRNRYRRHYGYRAACVLSRERPLEAFSDMRSGAWLKNRTARVALVVGDLFRVDERRGNAPAAEIEAEFVYWHALLTGLGRFVRNIAENGSLRSGKMLTDALNHRLELTEAIRHAAAGTEATSDVPTQVLHADILIALHASDDEITGILPKEQQDRVTVIRIGPDLRQKYADPLAALHSVMADLYVAGAELDWLKLHPDGSGRMIDLPPYPFSGKSLWIGQEKGE
jgi:acyl-CoA synthetase (AMP-forming)/AMP-acid ligase II/3-oxoacyl-(acyl-carrier-protein) synthase/acyl carrier protein